MIRSHPVLTACALALLLPTAAAADPVQWEVSAQFARVGDAGGPMAFLLTPEHLGGGSTIHEQTFSRLAAEGPHAGWGWQSFRVGSLFPDGPRLDPLHGAPGDFAATVTLTDRATGQTGTAAFRGFGWETIDQDSSNIGWLLSRRANVELRGDTEQTLTVGGTEYQLGLRAVNRDDIVDFFADVRAGAAHATPEPGTLALAALGLGAVVLRRRRKAVAAVVLLLVPQFAAAGPLSWGFRAEAPDGAVYRDVTGLTDTFYVDNFLPDPRLYGIPVEGPPPSQGYYSDMWESQATVTITDGASGASGSFVMWLAWVQSYDIKPDGSVEPIYEGYNSGPWADPAVLALGANVYSVRGPGGDMQVTVTPAVATPEPGTLALAAVGLVPLLRRVARRGPSAARCRVSPGAQAPGE